MADEENKSLISVKDLAGVSAPLTKLVETVDAALGRLSGGMGKVINTYLLARKDARNEAERIALVEGAKTQAILERAQAFTKLTDGDLPRVKTIDVNQDGTVAVQLVESSQELSLNQRAEQRRAYQNALQQLNIESVVEIAVSELINEEQVSEELVKVDWTTRLFNIAQDISSADVQILLGKILAGEIKNPGSFSLRTLDVLRNLSQKEALLFVEVCNYVSDVLYEEIDGSLAIITTGMMTDDEFLYGHFSFEKITRLVDCGLINSVEGSVEPAERNDDKYSTGIRIGETLLFIEKPYNENLTVHCLGYFLTRAGEELYPLVDSIGNSKYILDLGLMLENEGFEVSYTHYYKEAKYIDDYEMPLKNFSEFKASIES